MIDQLRQDVRYAFRVMARDRGFSLVAALTLALGIAATASLVTVVNAVLVKGLPLTDPDRLVAITMRDPRNRQLAVSYPDFDDWHRAARSFSAMAVMLYPAAFVISDNGRPPEQYFGSFASANLFTTIGQRPFLGRDFRPEDDQPGAPPVLILGYGLWQARYAGDAGIVGRTVRMNGLLPTVIGVMGPDMRFPPNSDLWLPMGQTNTPRVEARTGRSFSVVARLADGVTLDQARAELAILAAKSARDYPDSNRDLVAEAVPYQEYANGPQVGAIYWSLLGAAVFVLLIACGNVANLLLARALHRSREVGIRLALGANRGRIVRQLLAESVCLASIGGLLSVPLVVLGVRLFDVMTRDAGRPYYVTYTLEPMVFFIIAGVCLAVGIAFGLAPAWFSARADINTGIKEGASTSGVPRAQQRWVSTMTVTQIALAVILLSGTGLLFRSALKTYDLGLGVRTPRVLALQIPLPGAKYPTSDDRLEFMRRLDERLAATGSIDSASYTSNVPLGGGVSAELSIDGRQAGAGERAPIVTMLAIGARYFEVLRAPMLRGRPFTDIDGSPGRDFAIINQRFADMYFPGTNPIGHSIRLTTSGALKTYSGAPAPALTIVGVSPTIRQRNTREPEPDAVVYVPRPSVALTNRATLLVRSARSATETAAVVREEIARLDPDLPIFNVRTLEADLANKRWPLVVIGSTFGLFAAIGLVLSAVSLFGLTSYLVANRTKEIALRMALGAMPSTLLRLLFGRVVAQTLIGITVGILGAYALGRVLQSMLVQTSATDVRVLAGVCLTLVVVAIATCLAPARRAARIEPADVLRTGR